MARHSGPRIATQADSAHFLSDSVWRSRLAVVNVVLLTSIHAGRDHVLDKQSYYVRVEPGEDAALMVCIAVLIDEMYNEEQAKKEGAADD